MLENVSPLRVLIVDAHDADRVSRPGRALPVAGAGRFEIVQASDAEEALRCCHDKNVRCLVLAHRPPQFDAGEFLARLRSEAPGFETPVVLLGDDSACEIARSYGAEAVLGDADLSDARLAFAVEKAVEVSRLRRSSRKFDAEEELRADALHDAKERFSCFMDALAAGAWIRDLDGTYVFANKTLAFAMNRTVAQIVGHKPEDMLPPDMVARRNEQNRRVAESDQGVIFMEALKLEGHPLRHLLINLFPIRDRGGVTRFVGGIAIDMSGMGNMLVEAPVAVALFDREMNYLGVSKRWSAEFGEPEGGHHGRSVHDLPPFIPNCGKGPTDRSNGIAGTLIPWPTTTTSSAAFWFRWRMSRRRSWPRMPGARSNSVIAFSSTTPPSAQPNSISKGAFSKSTSACATWAAMRRTN
jgi:PAS domain-containing protein